MKKTLRTLTVLVGLMWSLSGPAYGSQILIDNLGQAPGGLWNIGSTIGQAFTTGSAVTINSATFRHDWGGYVPSTNAYLTIQTAAADGKIGSTVLDTWANFTDVSNLVTFNGSLALAANTTYWLVLHDISAQVARTSSTTAYTANFGATLPATYNNYESSTGAYYSLDDKPLMFQVAVPDGGLTAILFGIGLLGLGSYRRRLK